MSGLFSPRRIRSQMYLGVSMLLAIVIVLLAGNIYGLLTFRNLTKSIRERSRENPHAASLGQQVSELRSELWKLSQSQNAQKPDQGIGHGMFRLSGNATESNPLDRWNATTKLKEVGAILDLYETSLNESETIDRRIAKNDEELKLVHEFRAGLSRISHLIEIERERDPDSRDLVTGQIFSPLETELAKLQKLVSSLPIFMQARMEKFSQKARAEFQTLVLISVGFGLYAIFTLGYLIWGFRKRIAHPLETLVAGSRQVAAGNYDVRIDLKSQDEVAELADAFNAMTSNFQTIKTDLNQQVQMRTKEVVRSEKMASVGFLAAGVAHEINNPLATIAWSAESLEMRLLDILSGAGVQASELNSPDVAEMLKYLKRIQEEAFRCKGITAGLLDFSRMGDVKKTPTHLSEVIEGVIEMVRPLSKYRDRNLHFHADSNLQAVCNAQEMKQVALNLITNALGSVEPGGTVTVSLSKVDDQVELRVTDDGCGMTDEILTHLFEPFFTRRRDGQGTGLGLSITYQIIQEHGGRISAQSAGPDLGSTFVVFLPLVKNESSGATKIAA